MNMNIQKSQPKAKAFHRVRSGIHPLDQYTNSTPKGSNKGAGKGQKGAVKGAINTTALGTSAPRYAPLPRDANNADSPANQRTDSMIL